MYKHARIHATQRTRLRTETSTIDNGPSPEQRERRDFYNAFLDATRERDRARNKARQPLQKAATYRRAAPRYRRPGAPTPR